MQHSYSALLHTSQSWYEKQSHDVCVRSLKIVFVRSETVPFFSLPGGKLDLDRWFSQEWQTGRCAADVKLSPASQRFRPLLIANQGHMMQRGRCVCVCGVGAGVEVFCLVVSSGQTLLKPFIHDMTVRPLAEVVIKHPPILSPLKEPAVPDLFALIPLGRWEEVKRRWWDTRSTHV